MHASHSKWPTAKPDVAPEPAKPMKCSVEMFETNREAPMANQLTFDLALPPPELQVAVEAHDGGASVRVTARRFARAVYLSTSDGHGAFSDNFFDLLPGGSFGNRVPIDRGKVGPLVKERPVNINGNQADWHLASLP